MVDATAAGLETVRVGVRFLAEAKNIFLFTERSRPAVGAVQPPFQWIPQFLPGAKAAGPIS